MNTSKPIFGVASLAITAALLSALFTGCSSNPNNNENINASARGASNGSTISSTTTNINKGGVQSSTDSPLDSEDFDEDEEEMIEDIDDAFDEDLDEEVVSDLDFEETGRIPVVAGQPKEYGGWFKVAFPTDMVTDEDEDYFAYYVGNEFKYSISFEIESLTEDMDDPDEDHMEDEAGSPVTNAREMAEETASYDQAEVSVKKVGKYTWYVVPVTVAYNNAHTLNTTYCFADAAPGECISVFISTMAFDSPEITSILESFEVLPGDPYKNFSTWSTAHFG